MTLLINESSQVKSYVDYKQKSSSVDLIKCVDHCKSLYTYLLFHWIKKSKVDRIVSSYYLLKTRPTKTLIKDLTY